VAPLAACFFVHLEKDRILLAVKYGGLIKQPEYLGEIFKFL
jgi:hypothetical protein